MFLLSLPVDCLSRIIARVPDRTCLRLTCKHLLKLSDEPFPLNYIWNRQQYFKPFIACDNANEHVDPQTVVKTLLEYQMFVLSKTHDCDIIVCAVLENGTHLYVVKVLVMYGTGYVSRIYLHMAEHRRAHGRDLPYTKASVRRVLIKDPVCRDVPVLNAEYESDRLRRLLISLRLAAACLQLAVSRNQRYFKVNTNVPISVSIQRTVLTKARHILQKFEAKHGMHSDQTLEELQRYMHLTKLIYVKFS